MKVCLISRFFDLRNGGIGRFSMEMKAGLEKRGFEVVAISDKGNYDGRSYLKYTMFDLLRLIPKDCDVYHCLTPMESLYSFSDKTVTTIHDLIPWLHSNGLKTHYTGDGPRGWCNRQISKYWFSLGVKAACNSRYIVTDSISVTNELKEHTNVNPDKLYTIRLGISPDLKPMPKPDKVFRIGTLSYLDARKRVDLLIKAFLEADIDGELVIGGTGRDADMLKALANGDTRVKFPGFIPEDKMCDFYNSLDLFVFPTKIEGYGLPIIEAMACGKPVVVLGDSTIPDEINLRCFETNVLRGSLIQFQNNQICGYSMGQSVTNNLTFARSHSWDTCIDEYVKIYEKIVKGE